MMKQERYEYSEIVILRCLYEFKIVEDCGLNRFKIFETF